MELTLQMEQQSEKQNTSVPIPDFAIFSSYNKKY